MKKEGGVWGGAKPPSQENFRKFDKVILTFFTKFGGVNEHLFVCGLSLKCGRVSRKVAASLSQELDLCVIWYAHVYSGSTGKWKCKIQLKQETLKGTNRCSLTPPYFVWFSWFSARTSPWLTIILDDFQGFRQWWFRNREQKIRGIWGAESPKKPFPF